MSSWPLVGRDAELHCIGESFDLRRHLMIMGPAGAGKTRLGSEGLALAAGRGLVPVKVTATSGARAIPFGAFASFVPDLSGEPARADVLKQIGEVLRAQGRGAPIALMIDDGHLLDEASTALIHRLADAPGVAMLITVRCDEPIPDTLTALWKDGLARRLDIAALPVNAMAELLEAVQGAAVARAAVQRFWQHSRGSPLYLRELVLAARENGALRFDDGIWSLSGPLPTSERLDDLVGARLGGLCESDRAALEWLSLADVVGISLFEGKHPAVDLADLERRGLVDIEPDGRRRQLRLAHPLYGESLRHRMSRVRMREISRNLADLLLEAGARRREDVLRQARWRLDGGGTLDPGLMLRAADQARIRCDFVLAERLARAGLQAGGGFRAGLLCAQAAWLQGRCADAETQFATLFPNDDGQRVELALYRSDNLSYGLGRGAEAVAVIEAVEAEVADPSARDTLTARRANLLNALGQTAAALDIALPLLDRTEGLSRAHVLCAVAYAQAVGGRSTQALQAAAELVGLLPELPGFPFQPAEAMKCLAVGALAHAGRVVEAEELGEQIHANLLTTDGTMAHVAIGLLPALILRGRLRRATELGWEAAAAHRELGQLPMLRLACTTLAQSLALQGRAEEANSVLEEIDGLGIPPDHVLGAELLRARAWAAAAAGALPQARGHLLESATLARAQGEVCYESAALHDLARIGFAQEALDRLRGLAKVIEGPLASVRADHAAALVGREPRALSAAGAAFEAMGAQLLAAEAAADAAVAWARTGVHRETAAARRRAQSLARGCPGARTPALLALAAPTALTTREQQIARLAASGVPNKEIAARLHLSVHTVENKLHATYEKLGIGGRTNLAEALGD